MAIHTDKENALLVARAHDSSILRRTAFRLMACVVLVAPLSAMAAVSSALPSYESVKSAHRSSDLQILDRYAAPIATIRVDYTERRGEWIALARISPALQRAVLLSEDQHFHQHGGVDWSALAAAGWNWLWGSSSRGASTISMQLAAMLDPSLVRPAGGRTVEQKVVQMRRARQLEAVWTKEQILEAYLNLVAFRGELRGIDAVARVMFGKHPYGLDPREAAVAAASLRGPNASAPLVSARACALLAEQGMAYTCGSLESDVHAWLRATARPAADTSSLAPHFGRLVASGHTASDGAQQIKTTLDAAIQRVVLGSVQRHLAGMGNSMLTDAAVVVLENGSGEILAYVGSSGDTSSAAQFDHARARRQAGSTLKPFLYAQALESRYLTAASLLNDAPLDVTTASGLYVPQNYDRGYAGWVSVRTALASSLNIPAVRVLMLVGPERFARKLRSMDLPLEHAGDHYGYSLALGSADVDLLHLTNAYRALAEDGQWTEPVSVAKQRTSENERPVRQVYDPMAAWLVGDIMADRSARARTFGLESVLSTRFWTAVKTGTSKDMRDNWTIGWSSRYTVGVWVGDTEGRSMRDVSGVTGAAPIWHEVISQLHEDLPSQQSTAPAGLETRRVEFAHDLEASRGEYFLPGTGLTRVEALPADTALRQSRILSPVRDTVIAFDPDMPARNQRLVLRAAAGQTDIEHLRWMVDGVVVGHGAEALWLPEVGRKKIFLLDEHGQVLDETRVLVKGLPQNRSAVGPGIAD